MEDEWFAIVRYQGDLEPRAFLSDAHAGLSDDLGELFTELAGVALDKDAPELGVRPAGDFELLDDLGMSSEELVELSMEEGVLPGRHPLGDRRAPGLRRRARPAAVSVAVTTLR